MNIIRTSIEIGSGVTDYEVEIDVQYAVHRGCAQTHTQPGEDDTVEIEAIAIIDRSGKAIPADWLHDLLVDDEELIGLCEQDAIEERAAQAEYRADARREDRLLGDIA